MFVRRTVIAAALVAVPLAFAAPALAQATPCSGGYGYFGPGETDRDKSICGMPNMDTSIQNITDNLKKNFSPGDAADNFKHNLTHGVGKADSAE
jgi:hypothetical protein